MDIAPQYSDAEYISSVKIIHDYEFTKPKLKKTTDLHPYLMVEPTKVDFRRPVRSYKTYIMQNEDYSQLMNMIQKGEEPIPYVGDMPRDDQEMLRALMEVNARQMSQCEKRCYDLLVKIEKEISWDTLLKIKCATFLVESDNEQWENPFFKAQNSMIRDQPG